MIILLVYPVFYLLAAASALILFFAFPATRAYAIQAAVGVLGFGVVSICGYFFVAFTAGILRGGNLIAYWPGGTPGQVAAYVISGVGGAWACLWFYNDIFIRPR